VDGSHVIGSLGYSVPRRQSNKPYSSIVSQPGKIDAAVVIDTNFLALKVFRRNLIAACFVV